MNFFTILSVASSIGSAFASFQQAQAMKAYYDAQADLQRLQYNQKRVEAREQGVKVLQETNRLLATATAQAAAGGILTTEGSAALINTLTLRKGTEDFQLSKLNEEIIQNIGLVEVRNTEEAGRIKQQSGIFGAITGFGTDIVRTKQKGLFDLV